MQDNTVCTLLACTIQRTRQEYRSTFHYLLLQLRALYKQFVFSRDPRSYGTEDCLGIFNPADHSNMLL